MENTIELEELRQWFISRKGYYAAQIKHDPSMSNPERKVLYAHASQITWKIYNDSSIPIYCGTGYMWKFVLQDIQEVVEKVDEIYGRT